MLKFKRKFRRQRVVLFSLNTVSDPAPQNVVFQLSFSTLQHRIMVEVYEVNVSNCETPWSESCRFMVPKAMVYEHQDGTAVSA